MLDDHFKLIMRRRLSNDSFKFIDQNAIKHWLWNDLLQNSFQANIVFDNQLWVSLVKFREYFTNLMVSKALFQQLSGQK